MKTLFGMYSFVFSAFGTMIYLTLISAEWFKDGKGNIPLMVGLFVLRYFFSGSVKGASITGNEKLWQVWGLILLDFILPVLFVYLLIK
jgi:hypothetical protein